MRFHSKHLVEKSVIFRIFCILCTKSFLKNFNFQISAIIFLKIVIFWLANFPRSYFTFYVIPHKTEDRSRKLIQNATFLPKNIFESASEHELKTSMKKSSGKSQKCHFFRLSVSSENSYLTYEFFYPENFP